MTEENLAELLTGKAFGIPRERLDMEGWVAAFRTYTDATAIERQAMEINLARAMLQSADWQFVVDAIDLARSLKMKDDLIRAAIVSAEVVAPQNYKDIIKAEARRYIRDVPRSETISTKSQEKRSTSTAEAEIAIKRDVATVRIDAGQSSSGEVSVWQAA